MLLALSLPHCKLFTSIQINIIVGYRSALKEVPKESVSCLGCQSDPGHGGGRPGRRGVPHRGGAQRYCQRHH